MIKVVYAHSEDVRTQAGGNTAYVERTHLTARQMNGRLVCKVLSFSKEVAMLKAACAWEDVVYKLTRSLKNTGCVSATRNAGGSRAHRRL